MKLFTSNQMRQVDACAIQTYGIPSVILMEHAAYSIYQQCIPYINKKQRIHIVCGTGNNGGDGFALARILFQDGYQVSVQLVGDSEKCSSDCAVYYNICQKLHIPIDKCNETHDIIFDAIFGSGLSREVQGIYATTIEFINKSHKEVYSIDIPSGICANTGKKLGCAIQATHTFTLQLPKIGLYIGEGRKHANKISMCDILIPQQIIDEVECHTHLIQREDMISYLPNRQQNAHKGTYGKVLCIGGSESMSGAICMASLSALKAGCGLLTSAIPNCINDVFHYHVLEAMSISLQDKDGFIHESCLEQLNDIEKYTCALVGCGLGRQPYTSNVVRHIISKEMKLVLDADALYFLKDMMDEIHPQSEIIITPHMKEFSVLINQPLSQVLLDPRHYVHQFCKEHSNIILVLKSDTTIIAHKEEMYINTFGNNGLSVGGSGDVLAGVISGLLAQNNDPFKAAILGVFLHAYSADILLNTKSVYSMLPSDIIQTIEMTMKQLDGEKYD